MYSTTDKEKYEKYNTLKKDVLIGMLIEFNNQLDRAAPRVEYKLPEILAGSCGFFISSDTSGNCNKCGKKSYYH